MPRKPSPTFIARPTGVFRFPKEDEYYRYIKSPKALWHNLAASPEDSCWRGGDPANFEIYELTVQSVKGSKKKNGRT